MTSTVPRPAHAASHRIRIAILARHRLHLIGKLARPAQLASHPEISREAEHRVEQLGCLAGLPIDVVRAAELGRRFLRSKAVRRPGRSESDPQTQLESCSIRRLFEVRDQLEGADQVRPGQGAGGAAHRQRCRVLVIVNRAGVVTPVLEVRCKLGRDLRRSISISSILEIGDTQMPLLRLAPAHTALPQLAMQHVGKGKPNRLRSIRPVFGASRLKEPLANELRAALFDHRGRNVEGGSERGRRTLDAGDARRFEHAPIAGGQPIPLPGQKLMNAGGHHLVDRRELAAEDPSVVAPQNHVARAQIADDVAEEQRMAAGSPVKKLGQLPGKDVLWKSRIEILRHIILTERCERELDCRTAGRHLVNDAPERCARRRHLERSTAADDQEPRRLAPTADDLQQIERRGVGPVQIFQDEQERCVGIVRVGIERLERFGQLAQHTLAIRLGHMPLHLLTLGGIDQRRQLQQP